MILPSAERAVVPRAKVVAYLLSLSHKAGSGKAAFFIEFGFHPDRWEQLASALQRHVADNEVRDVQSTPFGVRYVIDGPLFSPSLIALNVRSVWFISRGEVIPRFVTAHPLQRRRP